MHIACLRTPSVSFLLQDCLQMTAEQKQRVMQLRGSFLQEQAHHQAQWRLLCQCMHQVCRYPVETLYKVGKLLPDQWFVCFTLRVQP